MYATLFALGAAFIGILGMALYGMPVYVSGALVVSGIATGMAADGFRTKSDTAAK